MITTPTVLSWCTEEEGWGECSVSTRGEMMFCNKQAMPRSCVRPIYHRGAERPAQPALASLVIVYGCHTKHTSSSLSISPS